VNAVSSPKVSKGDAPRGGRKTVITQPVLQGGPSAAGRARASPTPVDDNFIIPHAPAPQCKSPEEDESQQVAPVVPTRAKVLDTQGTARALLLNEPPLLQFILSSPKTIDSRNEAFQQTVPPETLQRLGAQGHSSMRFRVQAEKNTWKLIADDLRSCASSASASPDYAAKKIAAAARFIDSFPSFNREEIFLSSKEKMTLKREQKWVFAEEREKGVRMGKPPLEMVPHDPESNRLDDSLTEDAVREVCDAMYDLMSGCGGHGVANGQELVIGCVEAVLMAWDLTSEIQGAWRVPLTIVTDFRGRQYSYVCVLILHGAQVAAVGRCVLEQLSYVPLARQRASDIISRFSAELVRRGHELRTIFLGLPGEAPAPRGEASSRPLIWRYLKLSCVRQEWMSLLATVDLYFSQRRAIRRTLLLSPWSEIQKTALPRGFAPLPNKRGMPRLKAALPTMKHKKRPRKRIPLPPLRRGDVEGTFPVSEIGAWKADEDELRLALFGDMKIVGAGDMEDCSSVSSGSLEDFQEDRSLDYFEAVAVEDLKIIPIARGNLAKPSLVCLPRSVYSSVDVMPRSSSIYNSVNSMYN